MKRIHANEKAGTHSNCAFNLKHIAILVPHYTGPKGHAVFNRALMTLD